MADNRTASVTLRADTKPYQAAMRQASRATTEMDKAQAKAQRNAERWEAIGTASKVAGAGIAAGLLYATKAASNQEQALGALQAVFRSNGAAMEANARSATKLGLSTTEYAENAARLGGQLGNLGISQDDLGATTDDLIRKAADMAAQWGGPTSDAVQALGALMRGERDPIEAYGVTINDAMIQAEQAASGLDKTQATLKLLNDQLAKSNTIGAWSREMETAASQTLMAQKEFDDATASLGEGLLPVMADVTAAIAKGLEWFNALPQSVKTATTYVAAFGAAALIAGPRLIRMATAAWELKTALAGSGMAAAQAAGKVQSVGMLAGKITAIGTAATIAVPLVQELFESITNNMLGTVSGDFDLMTQQVLAFSRDGSSGIGRFGDSLMGLGDAFAQNASVFDQWVKMGPFNTGLNSAEGEIQSLDQTLAQMVSNGYADEAARAVQMFQQQTIAAGGSAEDVTGALPQYGEALETTALSAENAANASEKDAAAKERQAAATKQAVEAYEAYLEAVRLALGLIDAQDALIGQEKRLADAVKKNGDAVLQRTEAGKANRAAINAEVESIANLIEQTQKSVAKDKDAAAGIRAANRVRREQIRTLLDNAEAAGLDREQVKRLQSVLELLKPINTSVTVSGLSEAEKRAKSLLDNLIQVSGLGSFGFGGPRPRRRAKGGYISGPGGPTGDKIPAMLSDGEYVVRASAVDRLGVGFFDAVNGYAAGGVVGYARGGRTRRGRGGRGDGGADMRVTLGSALRDTQRWSEAVAEARDNIADLRQQRDDYAASLASGIIGNAGPSIFDQFSANAMQSANADLEAATATRQDAEAELQAARVALNTSSPEERAAAMDRLAKAQQAYNTALSGEADAQQAVTAATPSAGNIVAAAQERANRVVTYAANVKKLMARGMSMAMIKELAGTDILQAGPIIDALLSMPEEQFGQLQAADARMRAAADSVGQDIAGKAFTPQMVTARLELDENQEGLNKAVKVAVKFMDKRWRRVLFKAGLGAEERVELMQSIRDNDGKLTRFWRNKLAKAGLGAEERQELVDAITAADGKLNDWSAKDRRALLRAARDTDFDGVVSNTGTILDDLTRKERKALLKAAREDGFDGVVSAANTVLDGYSTKERKAILAAMKDTFFDGNVNDAVSSADRVNGRRTADLAANKIGEPVRAADEVSGAADRVRGDRVADLKANKVSQPVEAANEVTNAADRVKGDRTAGLKADKLGEPIKAADEVFNAANRIDRTFSARLTVQVAQDEVDKATKWVEAFARWQRAARRNPEKAGPAPTPGNLGRWGKARGGLIVGAGTATSDSIPAMLSNGEYVIRAAAVSKYGADLMAAINTGRFAAGGPVGFRTTTTAPVVAAGGGRVQSTTVPVVVKLDNRTVATGQLKVARQSGGTVIVGG